MIITFDFSKTIAFIDKKINRLHTINKAGKTISKKQIKVIGKSIRRLHPNNPS